MSLSVCKAGINIDEYLPESAGCYSTSVVKGDAGYNGGWGNHLSAPLLTNNDHEMKDYFSV